MSRALRRLAASCLCLSVLAGCSNEGIVDHIRIVSVLGFDKNEAGYSGTALYADYAGKGKITTLRANAKQTNLVLNEFDLQSAKHVRIEKLRMLFFSKSLAEQGISSFLKTICKDPLISNYLIMAVSEESAAALSESLAGKESIELPYHLIEHNMRRGTIPLSNLSTVLFDYYGTGRDFSVPYLRLNGKGDIEIAGYGIFKDDRLKLVLNRNEMLHYKMLQGKYLKGDIPFTVSDGKREGSAIFSINYGKQYKTVDAEPNKAQINFNFQLNGMVKEYPEWFDLKDEAYNDRLLAQLEAQIRDKLSSLLLKLQEEKVDPLGIGDLVRSRRRSWSEEQFYAAEYSNVDFGIRLHLRISKSGIGE
ncbi:Ger(x)C family spore germination protein [Paenibacillus arenilitoris]|uniref:Ger(X)C family spore germination protein n=1 Tax=Paenibacillus arenilitoris TaxID=2772299 RepID=A0A927H4P5_9BACL|nr:Ger(x)C family spore germination protein [Paenibacillus arenilitoris]MBD2867602.1 Ger(x)C family spore germination protein [Paenibacillus arenilitoris]